MNATINNLRSGERERQMYCFNCGAEYSADKADYFMSPPSDELIDCECGNDMEIVIKSTTHAPVQA